MNNSNISSLSQLWDYYIYFCSICHVINDNKILITDMSECCYYSYPNKAQWYTCIVSKNLAGYGKGRVWSDTKNIEYDVCPIFFHKFVTGIQSCSLNNCLWKYMNFSLIPLNVFCCVFRDTNKSTASHLANSWTGQWLLPAWLWHSQRCDTQACVGHERRAHQYSSRYAANFPHFLSELVVRAASRPSSANIGFHV